jgi:hypothetical protein
VKARWRRTAPDQTALRRVVFSLLLSRK